MTGALTCSILSTLNFSLSRTPLWNTSLHLKVLFLLFVCFDKMITWSRLCDLYCCVYLSHSAGAWSPCRLHHTVRSWEGGSRRHCGPQQAKAEAGRPVQHRAPYRHRRRFREQRWHQRGLQPPPLQRLVKGTNCIMHGTSICGVAKL